MVDAPKLLLTKLLIFCNRRRSMITIRNISKRFQSWNFFLWNSIAFTQVKRMWNGFSHIAVLHCPLIISHFFCIEFKHWIGFWIIGIRQWFTRTGSKWYRSLVIGECFFFFAVLTADFNTAFVLTKFQFYILYSICFCRCHMYVIWESKNAQLKFNCWIFLWFLFMCIRSFCHCSTIFIFVSFKKIQVPTILNESTSTSYTVKKIWNLRERKMCSYFF